MFSLVSRKFLALRNITLYSVCKLAQPSCQSGFFGVSSSTLFFLAPDGNVVSGLTFKRSIDQKTFFISNNFSACISLKVKRMSTEKSAMLLNIETSEGFWFFKLYARYPATWFHFDDTSWVIKDLWTNSYHFWKINVWHHICFSYSESNSFISLVKVTVLDQ